MKKYINLLLLVLMLKVYWKTEGLFSKEIDRGEGIVIGTVSAAYGRAGEDGLVVRTKVGGIERINLSSIYKSKWVEVKTEKE